MKIGTFAQENRDYHLEGRDFYADSTKGIVFKNLTFGFQSTQKIRLPVSIQIVHVNCFSINTPLSPPFPLCISFKPSRLDEPLLLPSPY